MRTFRLRRCFGGPPYRHLTLFLAILIGYAAYAGLSIWRSSSVLGGERYFILPDDPMISMRYARNLVAGHGLVWNAGEAPVEGYTNPLWVLIMAGVHELPLPLSKTSGAVQIFAGVLLLTNLFVVRRLALASGANDGTAIGAAFLTAFCSPLNSWGLGGFEVALIVPLIGIALTRAIGDLRQRRFSAAPYWILGIATLVRLDASVIYMALLLALVSLDRPNRVKHVRAGVLIFSIFMVGQTSFRLAYYGEWLPNTYYLKMTGYPVAWRAAWGIRNLMAFVWHRHPALFLVAGLALVRRDSSSLVLASVAGAQFAYVCYAGASDSRFATTAMPVVFVLFAFSLQNLGALIKPTVARVVPRVADRSELAFAALFALSLLGFNAGWPGFPKGEGGLLIERVRALEDLTTPDARVAVVAAGAVPYFLDRPAIDLLGKNDYALAREPAHPPFTSFKTPYVSGHVKWDYAYSLGKLQPDVVVGLWRNPEEAVPYLHSYRTLTVASQVMYLRSDSTHIRWDRVGAYESPPPSPSP